MAPTSIMFYKDVGHSQEGAKEVTTLLDESISQFWKNRTTLMKLGRLYVSNFFKNLKI